MPSNFTGGDLTVDQVIDGATITSDVNLLANIQFNNCIFNNASILPKKAGLSLGIKNFTKKGSKDLINCSTVAIIFTGSNYLLNNVVVDGGTMDEGQVLQGNYGTYNLTNYIRKVIVRGVTKKSVAGSFVSAAGIFDYDIYNNTWIYSGVPPTDGPDSGIININGGWGKIHDNYRSGYWGWLARIFGMKIKGEVGEVLNYNNIDLNHTEYGCIEMRSEPNNVANYPVQFCEGVNLRALNNLCGNLTEIKYAANKYSNAVVLIPNLTTGNEAEVRNNASFNCQTLGYKNSEQGGTNTNIGVFGGVSIAKLSNNKYYKTYQEAGLADDVNCQLLSTSPLINAGYTTPIVDHDISGTLRPQGANSDIGAREFIISTPIPPPVKQRTAVAVTFDITGKMIFAYDDGSK